MKQYYLNDNVIARHITEKDIKQGLCFFSDNSDFIQVGSARYNAGAEAQAHIHNVVERTISKTCEVFVVLRGKIKVTLYDYDDAPFESIIVAQGETLTLLDGGHSIKYLDDETILIEVKNGPFYGVEIDKRKF